VLRDRAPALAVAAAAGLPSCPAQNGRIARPRLMVTPRRHFSGCPVNTSERLQAGPGGVREAVERRHPGSGHSDAVRTPYSCPNIQHGYPILISQHARYIRTHISRLSSLAYHLDMFFFFLANCIAV